ncbi:DUF4156 domain-containing protein [Colwellia sp. RSH04]|uniref:DUF4156 domain-containing protein n=1 Tax=Colwellia sp. RSH04 TaxID=2305464 RepID=UPI000E597DB0|nr:DUF4156 domain-containing protein [Colwellia sp. RSH04]RHW77067.1 DUF4156 domain-containing protein [Colwellia sp. RSH04]
MTRFSLVFLIFVLSSCSMLEIKKIKPGDEKVRLYSDEEKIRDCRYIDEVIGTQGHWYDYLFISNKNLTQGAINDLKTQARAIGANSVHVHTNMAFNTSVTILAQAYYCKPLTKK